MPRSCQGLPERSFRQYYDCRILEGQREKGELRELCENESFFFFCRALQSDWGVFFPVFKKSRGNFGAGSDGS